jgi:hypothetical protein
MITAEVRVLSKIYGGQSGSGISFSRNTSFFPCQCHSASVPQSLIYQGHYTISAADRSSDTFIPNWPPSYVQISQNVSSIRTSWIKLWMHLISATSDPTQLSSLHCEEYKLTGRSRWFYGPGCLSFATSVLGSWIRTTRGECKYVSIFVLRDRVGRGLAAGWSPARPVVPYSQSINKIQKRE